MAPVITDRQLTQDVKLLLIRQALTEVVLFPLFILSRHSPSYSEKAANCNRQRLDLEPAFEHFIRGSGYVGRWNLLGQRSAWEDGESLLQGGSASLCRGTASP